MSDILKDSVSRELFENSYGLLNSSRRKIVDLRVSQLLEKASFQPAIERQMLLAQFACRALCLYVGEEIAADCFRVAEEMLAEFYARVRR